MSNACAVDNARTADDGPTITAWAEMAKAGDQTAFHRLVDLCQAEIFRMIFYRTRSKMDAEDLTQDVFLKAFKHIRRLESPALFRSWLFRIALNRVRDHFRRRRIKALLGMVSIDGDEYRKSGETAEPPQAPLRIDRSDFWQRVQNLLTSLSPMEREVFVLRFFDQLSLKEIGMTLNKNENTIKTHLYRALNKVKTSVATDGAWEGI